MFIAIFIQFRCLLFFLKYFTKCYLHCTSCCKFISQNLNIFQKKKYLFNKNRQTKVSPQRIICWFILRQNKSGVITTNPGKCRIPKPHKGELSRQDVEGTFVDHGYKLNFTCQPGNVLELLPECNNGFWQPQVECQPSKSSITFLLLCCFF